MARWLKRIAWILGGLVLTLLLVVGAALAFLSSGAGRDWAIAQLEKQTGGAVQIEGAGGSLFGRFTVDRLRLTDRDGVWLSVEQAVLDWQPAALFGRTLRVEALTAETVRVARAPQPASADAPAPTEDPGPVSLPSLPLDVRVGRLAVDEVELAAPVMGRPARLSLAGDATLTRKPRLDSDVTLAVLGEGAGGADIDLLYDPDGKAVSLKVVAEGPPQGFLASLTGQPDRALALDFQADGAPEAGDGTLRLNWGDAGAAFDLNWGARSVELQGQVEPGDLMPAEAQAYADPPIPVRLALRDIGSDGAELAAQIQAAAGDLSLAGPVRFDDLTRLDGVRLELDAKPAALPLPDGLAISRARVTADLGGTAQAPTADLVLALGGIDGPDYGTDQIRLTGRAGLDGSAVSVDLALVGDEVRFRGEPLAPVSLNLVADGDFQARSVALQRLEAELPGARLSGSGSADLSREMADLRLRLAVPDLAAYRAYLPQPLAGRLALEARVERGPDAPAYRTRLDLETEGLSTGIDLADTLLGSAPTLRGAAAVQSDGRLDLDRLLFNGAQVKFGAEGSVAAAGGLDLRYELALTDLQSIAAIPAASLQGAFTVDGQLVGTLDNPAVTARAELDQLRIQQIVLQGVEVRTAGIDLGTAPVVETTVNGDSTIGPLTGRVLVEPLEAGGLIVPDITLSVGGLDVDGQLSLPGGQPVEGLVNLVARAAPDEVPGLDGNAVVEVRLDGVDGAQRLVAKGDIDQLETPLGPDDFLRLDRADLSAEVVLPQEGLPQANIELSLNELLSRAVQIDESRLSVTGDGEQFEFSALLDGILGTSVEVQTRGDVALSEGGQGGRLGLTLAGEAAGARVMAERLDASWGPQQARLEPVTLRWGEGTLRLAGGRQGDSLEANAELDGLELGLLSRFFANVPVTGQVDGRVSYRGEGQQGQGRLSLTADKIAPRVSVDADDDGPETARLSLTGTLAGGQAELEGELSTSDGGRGTVSGQVPLRIDAANLAPVTPDPLPLQAQLAWQGAIAPLISLAALPDLVLNGDLRLDAAVAGTAAAPEIEASLGLQDGYLELRGAGFVADALQIEADYTDQRLTLTKLDATDGADGSLSASGTLTAGLDGLGQADLSAQLDRMVLVRRPEVEASASGELGVSSDGERLSVTGGLSIPEANVQLISNLPPSVATLDVIEVNGDMVLETPESEAEPALPIDLDLTVEADNQLFVRGRGLDSEWKTDLEIGGQASEPVVTGTVGLVRGTFDFGGKRFTLEEGRLVFNGETPPNPRLFLVAQYEVETSSRDYVTQIRVTGEANEPDLALTSTPDLPEEEILALILFGTNVSELSPLDAASLAYALNGLRSGGGGVQGTVRRTLGLDTLALGTDEEDNQLPQITAGKYLTNNIYLEVSTATATGNTTARLEVELTRRLSLISELGAPPQDSNLGIRWSFDY